MSNELRDSEGRSVGDIVFSLFAALAEAYQPLNLLNPEYHEIARRANKAYKWIAKHSAPVIDETVN